MKTGDRITCPHCGEATIVKSKPKLDGWTRVGDVLICALCGAEVGVPDPEAEKHAAAASTAALAALLGGETAPKPRLDPGSEHRRFCRNCRHRIEHPFVLRCGRDGHTIDPGGCCENFTEGD